MGCPLCRPVITPVGVGAVHSFAPRSGDISVLLVLTAPAALSGRTVFGGGGAGIGGVTEGDGQLGILGGVGKNSARIPRCLKLGASKSKLLHSLVLSLWLLELEYGMTLHVIHISGKRMIAQGTDGCSHGSLMEGVMAGEDMLTLVDLG